MDNVKAAELSCAVVIPVYNEEKVVADTVSRLKQITDKIPNWHFEIICVDDGSTDGTPGILSGLTGVKVLSHHVNRGYGAALKTGLNSCSQEWIFIVDADATYPLEDLVRLVGEVRHGADMVVGARQGQGITRSPFRRLARWILRKMTHFLTGAMVPDLNSGMRIFRRRLYLEFKNLLPMGFSFTTTLTMASLYTNYRIKYLPINYTRRVGKSNIKPVRDFFGFLMLIIRIASYFEPLRFFLPLAFMIMFLGFLKGARDFILLGHIGGLVVTVFLMGVQVFITGILAEVIVRRSSGNTNA